MAHLPEGFAWGAATSAYQIEGARSEGGKVDSIWDVFADAGRVPGIELLGCDHYHRMEEDLDLLAGLGVNAYRFSVAWTRLMSDADGRVNPEGVDFYRRLTTGLRSRGITPYLTLYHWDLPQSLQEAGGWASRATVEAFDRYASAAVNQLGDLVSHWITHNEPWVATMLGHQQGVFAPGISDWDVALTAGHHILVSHGRAVSTIREAQPEARIGIALDCRPAEPATDSEPDMAATRYFDGYRNRWFFDPVFGLGYPEDMVEDYQRRGRIDVGAVAESGDMDLIATPIDFLGLNYYTTIEVSDGEEESEFSGVAPGPNPPPGYAEMGWLVDPAGMTGFLERVHDEYHPSSIIITENGASYSDGPDSSGRVADQRRIDYIEQHIGAVVDARESGVPVDGYFVWSLLDNLEWTSGFGQRFGLVWVDHETGARLPKDSYKWYRDLISRENDRAT